MLPSRRALLFTTTSFLSSMSSIPKHVPSTIALVRPGPDAQLKKVMHAAVLTQLIKAHIQEPIAIDANGYLVHLLGAYDTLTNEIDDPELQASLRADFMKVMPPWQKCSIQNCA